MKKTNINDLYFGVVTHQMSYSTKEGRNELSAYNLFDSSRVKWSVARYVTMSEREKKQLMSDPLHFCFGDTLGRTEWEFIVCPWPYQENEKVEDCGRKVDVFSMYVEPNASLLMDMVNNVSISSAKKYMTEWRKRYNR